MSAVVKTLIDCSQAPTDVNGHLEVNLYRPIRGGEAPKPAASAPWARWAGLGGWGSGEESEGESRLIMWLST
jgi:hypothetical protein